MVGFETWSDPDKDVIDYAMLLNGKCDPEDTGIRYHSLCFSSVPDVLTCLTES